MRRILLLVTDLEIGGTPTVVRELAHRLNDRERVQVHVACLSRWGPMADQIRDLGIEVTSLNAVRQSDFGVFFRLRRLMIRKRIDTIVSFLVHANFAATVASQLFLRVRVFQSIQTTQEHPAWHWAVQAVSSVAAEAVIVPSRACAGVAMKRSLVPERKIRIIPNAIDVRAFQADRRQFSPDRVDIGFIGRLDPVKRVHDAIEAMRFLPGQFHLHIFGDGAMREKLEWRAADRKVRHRVSFHGAVARPQDALKMIDLLVLPSSAEGFGLVLIEAMAAGVPVIATEIPAVQEIVTHEQTALLVPVGRSRAIAEAVVRLSGDEALRTRMTRLAREKVLERFTWDGVIREYRRVLELES